MAMINAKKLKKLMAELVKQLGRPPTDREFLLASKGYSVK